MLPDQAETWNLKGEKHFVKEVNTILDKSTDLGINLHYFNLGHNTSKWVVVALIREEDPLGIMVIYEFSRNHCVLGSKEPAAVEVLAMVFFFGKLGDSTNEMRFSFLSQCMSDKSVVILQCEVPQMPERNTN